MATDTQAMKTAHKKLAEFTYALQPVERGYAGRALYINLSDNTISSKPVSQQMKDIFVGGKGFGLWLLWNGIRDTTKWNDPENEIVISPGPIGGITTYPVSGKSLVVTISPTTHSVMDSNVGGSFGPYLKFAGWDAIEIQGKANNDVIIFIDGDTGKVTIEEAPLEAVDSHILSEQIVQMYAASPQERVAISSVSAGSGAEKTLIGCLNFSWYDVRRKLPRLKQAGRGGTGTVLRDKRVKALVVKFSGCEATPMGRRTWAGCKGSGSKCTKSYTTTTISNVRCAPSARLTWSRLWTITTFCRSTISVSAGIPTPTRSLLMSGRSGTRKVCPTAAGTAVACRAATESTPMS